MFCLFCFSAGQDDYDRIRPLSYLNTDVFLLLFSVISQASLENIKAKWWPEIAQHCPNTPVILVGTKSDLRDDQNIQTALGQRGLSMVQTEEGMNLARHIGAVAYHECSALTQQSLKQVFDDAIRIGLERKHKQLDNHTAGCVVS